jgi:acyl-CoA thioester hydrolase
MGIVYYAKYLEYFEMGRTEFIRKRGKEYRSIEEEGYFLPVLEVWTKYKKPAHYDDLLTVETEVKNLKKASLEFHYTVKSKNGDINAEGTTKHALINREGKIVPFPSEIREKLLTL